MHWEIKTASNLRRQDARRGSLSITSSARTKQEERKTPVPASSLFPLLGETGDCAEARRMVPAFRHRPVDGPPTQRNGSGSRR